MMEYEIAWAAKERVQGIEDPKFQESEKLFITKHVSGNRNNKGVILRIGGFSVENLMAFFFFILESLTPWPLFFL